VELREGSDDEELMVLLADGELDLAFGGVPPAGPFEFVEMLRDDWFLLTRAGSPLAGLQGPLSVTDLRDEPLIAFRSTSSTEARLEEFLRGSGLVPRIVFRTDDNPTVQGLVAAGFGSAFLPALAIDMGDPRLVRIPMDIPPRTLAVAWHLDRTLTAAARAFVDAALEVCAELDLPSR
jgi:LysR family transcriptional activator of glutamate synthase operon